MSSTSKALKINQLSFGFSKNKLLFNNLTMTIPRGGFSLLIGPTGAGKSTLLKLICQLYPEFGGKIYHGNLENTPKNWSMIFQDPDKQFTMATPRQEFIFTLENLNLSPAQAKNRTEEAIAKTKIIDLLDENFNNLSGGEKQRVAFAIAIAMKPDLLLLDEPFASCDPQTRSFLLEQLKELKQANTTIIIVDHQLGGYQNLVDDVYQVQDQNISLLSPSEKIAIFSNLRSPAPTFELPQKKSNSLFKLENFSLKAGKKELIKQESLTIPPSSTILLTGENGSGKSSFFKALTKIIPYQGALYYQQKEIQKYKARAYLAQVSQIFQDANDQFLMVTVKEELDFSLEHNHNPLIDKNSLAQILTELDLASNQDQVVYSLSGGQKKKLQILEMIMANPTVLLLDEPFAGLDKKSCQLVINLIKKYYLIHHKSIILISHQFSLIDQLCTYHLHLEHKHLKFKETL